MERHVTNANHTWQDADGFVQACEVVNGQRVLYCSGQLAVSPEGKPMHAGDMRAQINAALDNVEALLKSADFCLDDVVRLNVYTTDVDLCLQNFDAVTTRTTHAGCRQACTLLGVTRLAWPEAMVEIEVTAAA